MTGTWAITGGCGFVGRNVIRYLLANGVQPGNIRVFDNLSVGKVADLERVTGHVDLNGGWAGNAVAVHKGDIRHRDETSAALLGLRPYRASGRSDGRCSIGR